MKLVYISGDYIQNDLPGVEKKIQDQLSVLAENGVITGRIGVGMTPRLQRLVPFSASMTWGKTEQPEADCLYIRMEPFSYPFISFLKKNRKRNPEVRILVEIPTYPYDEEIKRLNVITQIRDKVYRRFLKNVVDRIVTYSDNQEIFGIRAIGIQNGVNVQSLPVTSGREPDQEVHLIAVAALQAYHGYERIIEGLHRYYSGGGERIVRFLIVGSGYAEAELRDLVRKYHLEEYVIFFGARKGSALTEVYNQGDIGVGSFGLYKRKDFSSSALKTREYLARGLPMISGCMEDVFQGKDVDFYLEFENNETPIDIQQVIDFHDKVYSEGKESLSGRILEFALKNVDVRHTFMPVVEYITGTGEKA